MDFDFGHFGSTIFGLLKTTWPIFAVIFGIKLAAWYQKFFKRNI